MPQLAKRSQEWGFSPCVARVLKGEKGGGMGGAGQGAALSSNVTEVQGRGKNQGCETSQLTCPPGNSPSWMRCHWLFATAMLASSAVRGEAHPGNWTTPPKIGPQPLLPLLSLLSYFWPELQSEGITLEGCLLQGAVSDLKRNCSSFDSMFTFICVSLMALHWLYLLVLFFVSLPYLFIQTRERLET